MASRNPSPSAFTIVELLVVVVIIAVLAAITLVMYNGISQEAIKASLKSDLANAAKALKAYNIEYSGYPNSISDCPTPSSGNLCLKSSSGNSFSSYSKNNTTVPATFSLTASNGSNIYLVTHNSNPIALAPAPLNPVADWLAMSQGDHYGNYYDLVGKQWATVTRASTKTIYDPTTNKIYDVPANKLGINPRSDGKNGSEAVIEEARTNYLLNSSFETDGNSDGLGDNWLNTGINVHGTTTFSFSSSAIHNPKSQRFQYTGIATDTNVNNNIHQATAIGSFAAGETARVSFYVKGSLSGCVAYIYIDARDAAGTYLGAVSGSNLSISQNYSRYEFSYSNLPANTSYVNANVVTNSIDNGDSFDLYVDAAQVEKGAFATSYIPTTTTTVTRNADVVTIPTSSWSSTQGSIIAVADPSTRARYLSWIGGSNYISLYRASGNQVQGVLGGTPSYSAAKVGTFISTAAMTWVNGGSLYGYMDGVAGTATSGVTTSSYGATANVGGYAGYDYINGPMQRLTIYNSALTSGDVTTVTNAIKDGPQ